MSDKIDVLAVMERAIQSAPVGGYAEERKAAKSAIEELIDSMPLLLALYRIKWGNLDKDANAVYERAKSALSGVGSA